MSDDKTTSFGEYEAVLELHAGDRAAPPDRGGQRLNSPAIWLLIDQWWYRLPYRSIHKARAAVLEALAPLVGTAEGIPVFEEDAE